MNSSKEISNVTDIRDAFAVFLSSFARFVSCICAVVFVLFRLNFILTFICTVWIGSVHLIAMPNFKITLWHCVLCMLYAVCPKYKMWLTLTFKEHIQNTSCSWRGRWFFDIILCNVAFSFEKCYVCLFSCCSSIGALDLIIILPCCRMLLWSQICYSCSGREKKESTITKFNIRVRFYFRFDTWSLMLGEKLNFNGTPYNDNSYFLFILCCLCTMGRL